jgi:hypothetical protein
LDYRELGSWAEARANIRQILEGLNAAPALALAAAANPILALEELGYRIAPEARREVEDRLRFRPREAARLSALRRQIAEHAGHPLDPDSPHELEVVLFEELGLAPRDRARESAAGPDRALSVAPLPVQVGWAPAHSDPLEAIRGTHLIVEPLLEYRRLEASEPRLASAALYAELRSGKRSSPITRLRGRLKPGSASERGA